MPTIEFEGKTTEEAIEKACNQLHLGTDELKFEIISTGSSGIFGLGSKKARIKVNVEEKISPRTAREEEPETFEKRERSFRPERTDGPARGDGDRPRERRGYGGRGPQRERRGYSDRSGQAERRGPANREERPEREDFGPPREPARQQRQPRPRRPRFEAESQSERLPQSTEIPLPPTMAGPEEEVYVGPEDEGMIQGREALSSILEHMGVEATVSSRKISDRIILDVEGKDSGLLIGKKGVTLDALQFLINKIVNRSRTEKYRIVVDTEDYRQRRHQSLIDLANRMADKARRSKRPVTISQLSAHDRRVVHLALQDRPGLKTRSRGDGPLKNVVITPLARKSQHNRPGPDNFQDKPDGNQVEDAPANNIEDDIDWIE